jgi:predicted metallo-beta-lactamase superfamily hydrolase
MGNVIINELEKRSIEEASQMLEELLALIPRNERRDVRADYLIVSNMLVILKTYTDSILIDTAVARSIARNFYHPKLITDLQKAYRAVKTMQRSTSKAYVVLTNYYVECFRDLFSHYIEISKEHMQKDMSHEK